MLLKKFMEFDEDHWEQDVKQLIDVSHQFLARTIFLHAVENLGSEPFQRHSSRTGKSDGQTILRTKLHRSFWLVLHTNGGVLQLHFPDKSDQVHSCGVYDVQWGPGKQGQAKREKRIILPIPFLDENVDSCIELVE